MEGKTMKPSIDRLIQMDRLIEGMNRTRQSFKQDLKKEVREVIHFKNIIDVKYFYEKDDLVLEIVLPVLDFGLFSDSVGKFGEDEIRAVEEYYHVLFVREMCFENLDGTHWRFKSN
jgi:hypothetical protein